MRIVYSSKITTIEGLAEGEHVFVVRESDRHYADTIHAYLQLARTLTPQARQALGDKAKRAHGRPNHLPNGMVREVGTVPVTITLGGIEMGGPADGGPVSFTRAGELEELHTTNAALVARVAALEAICADASERLKKTPGATEVRKALAAAAKQ